MEEWKYSFDPVSKEAWIRQIASDLKSKDPGSLSREWWPGEPLEPILHATDLEDEIISLPDSLFSAPAQLVEWIDTRQALPQDINQKILSSLMYGAQSLILQSDELTVFSFEEWLKDVSVDFIDLSIQPDEIHPDTLFPLIRQIPDQVGLRLLRSPASQSLASFFGNDHGNSTSASSVKFVYRLQIGDNRIHEIIDLFNRLLDDHRQWIIQGWPPEEFFRQCVIWIDTDTDYFRNILQIRTLHVVWQNIKLLHHTDSISNDAHYLECHILPEDEENPDHYLIRASLCALGSSLSGVHAMCIHPVLLEQAADLYKRTQRNIHHLLNLESHMYKGQDPFAGAYVIDVHTRHWVQEIWKQLHI